MTTSRGAVSFEADGKTYTLSYSVNALIELEEAMGMSAMQIPGLFRDGSGIQLKHIRLLFWAGLRDHHADVTIAEAGEMMRAVGLNKAAQLIGKAFMGAFPEAEERASSPLGAGRDRGTGKSSSRRGASSVATRSNSGA